MQNSKNHFIRGGQRLVQCECVLEKKVMDETVLLHGTSGNYYALNPTAAAIWNYCAKSRQWTEIFDFVSREFQAENEPTFQEDIDAYLKELLREGMLEVVLDNPISDSHS